MKSIRGLVGLALLVGACGVQAQQGERVSRECRREVVQMCGISRDKIRACLIAKLPELSDRCRKEIAARAAGRSTPAAGAREITFGSDPKQRLDFVGAKDVRGAAPLVVFIHGGGWSIGDKAMDAATKAAHFTMKGYAFASVNYRLVPQAKVEDQAADIASALAVLRSDARALGVDPERIVLLGHSAGAHLAALVATDPRYLAAAHVPMSAVKGVVLLDGAGYDAPAQMANPRNPVRKMFVAAFGTEPGRQRALSPIAHVAVPNAARWLILPVASRADAQAQSAALAEGLRRAGTAATVTPVPDSSHMKLNRNLGVAGDYATAQVDAFIAKAVG